MSDNDNRLTFPPTPVDFITTVGETGQDHDNYPSPGQQPRYDWFRLYLISLLSMQSSTERPTQYRTGTPWYNKTTHTIEIYNGSEWVSLADAINVAGITSTNDVITLTDLYTDLLEKLPRLLPYATFSGNCVKDNSIRIPVPSTTQTLICDIFEQLRPIIYINGSLIDPRKVRFSSACPLYILLNAEVALMDGDKFTAFIQRYDTFETEDVIVSS
jgi:hypothetical protein